MTVRTFNSKVEVSVLFGVWIPDLRQPELFRCTPRVLRVVETAID